MHVLQKVFSCVIPELQIVFMRDKSINLRYLLLSKINNLILSRAICGANVCFKKY